MRRQRSSLPALVPESRGPRPEPGRLRCVDAPDAGFTVTTAAAEHGMVRVRLAGELDGASGSVLRQGVSLAGPAVSAPAQDVAGTVLLDLSALSFLDTGGLAALVDVRETLLGHGWRVCLTRPQRPVLRLLDLAVRAGWLPAGSACSDIAAWGPDTGTDLRMAPWPEITWDRASAPVPPAPRTTPDRALPAGRPADERGPA